MGEVKEVLASFTSISLLPFVLGFFPCLSSKFSVQVYFSLPQGVGSRAHSGWEGACEMV